MNTLTKFGSGFLLGGASLVALSLVSPRTGTAAPVAADKVTICHFGGHDGDIRIGPSSKGAANCASAGGTAVTIGIPSCLNGHEAESKKGTIDCRSDDEESGPPAPADPATPADE